MASQDLLNLQRVAGLGNYGAEADDLEKSYRKEINALKGTKRRPSKMSEEELRRQLNLLSQKQVEEIRNQFEGRIIRRTPTSRKWNGEPLLSLPPVVSHTSFVTLSDKEMEELDKIRDDAIRYVFISIPHILERLQACHAVMRDKMDSHPGYVYISSPSIRSSVDPTCC